MNKYVTLLLTAALLAGCAHKKKVTPVQTPVTEQETPAPIAPAAEPVVPAPEPEPMPEPEPEPIPEPVQVQTLYIPNMTLTVVSKGKQLTTPAVLSWQRGSGMILSIRPMIFEVIRMELTPEALTVIDKLNMQYVRMDYFELAQMGAGVTLEQIDAWMDEQIIARLDEPQIRLSVSRSGIDGTALINTPYVQTDVAVNLRPTNTANLRRVSVEQLLNGLK